MKRVKKKWPAHFPHIRVKASINKAQVGGVYSAAMTITNQIHADIYFILLVDRNIAMSSGKHKSRAEAQKIVRQNLGYYAGYYDEETRQRVFKLFKCEHPIFGTKTPTAREAFRAGVER